MSLATAFLEIAGLGIEVHAPAPLLESFLVRTGTYRSTPRPADLALEVRSSADFAPGRGVVAAFPAADAEWDGQVHRFRRRDFTAELTLAGPARALATCPMSAPGIIVENVLRLCLAVLVPRRGGLLLHASAIARQGHGFVFSGVSGAGKSTIIKLLGDDPVTRSLGDEVTIVDLGSAGAVVHSTPFGGELAPVPPGAAPLRRLFILRPPGPGPAWRSATCGRLLRNALTHANEPELAAALLANASSLLERTDVVEMYRPSRGELEEVLRD